LTLENTLYDSKSEKEFVKKRFQPFNMPLTNLNATITRQLLEGNLQKNNALFIHTNTANATPTTNGDAATTIENFQNQFRTRIMKKRKMSQVNGSQLLKKTVTV